MADRPANSYISLEEVEAEIRRMEEEICETRLLHENLAFVQSLARDVLQYLQNHRQQSPPQTSQASQATCNRPARPCACSPHRPCRHICVSPQSYQNSSGPVPNTTASRTNITGSYGSSPHSTTSGSTMAEVRVNIPLDGSCASTGSHPQSNNYTYTVSPSSVQHQQQQQSQYSQSPNMHFRYHFPQQLGPVGFHNNTC